MTTAHPLYKTCNYICASIRTNVYIHMLTQILSIQFTVMYVVYVHHCLTFIVLIGTS